MAVSSSTDFARTASELITDARELLGIYEEEEPLQAVDLDRGLKWLNYMLKAWQVDGVMAWTLTETSFALVQSDVDYVFGSGGTITTVPVDIQDVRITRNSYDLQMTRISREDYYAIPNKTTEGYPTQWFYDRQRDSGTFYVWPAPDSTGGTIKLTYRRRIMDMDASGNNFDLPQEWHSAIVYGLADALAPIYGKTGTPRGAEIKQRAAETYAVVKSFDLDEGESSIFIVPSSYQRPR